MLKPSQPRIACLYVPDFRLSVALRSLGAEPEGGLALVDPEDGRRMVVAASPGARLDGVKRGMPVITATTLAPEITVREVDRAALARSHEALEAAVRGVCPSFESTGEGVIYAAWSGLDRRYAEEGEGGLIDDLREICRGLGLPARVGMAGTRFTARAAAVMEGKLPAYGPAAIRVPCGEERRFLSVLPLELLPDALPLIKRLKRLGLHSLGDFAALPADGVARRHGAQGTALHRLARGEDRATLIPTPEPRAFEVLVHAEYPITASEALRFLLRRPLERLIAELDDAGLAARRLHWTLTLDGEEPLRGRTFSAAPSASITLWKDLVKVWIERLELPAPVLSVRLLAEEVERHHRSQERLSGPRAAPPAAMSITLAHLAAELGPEHFGALLPRHDLLPERRQRPLGRGFPIHVARGDAPEPWVPDRSHAGELPLAFRRVSPPAPITVARRGLCFRGFHLGRRFFPVERSFGPWDVSSAWWEARAEQRRYYQLEGRGQVAQVFLEPDSGAWFLAGWLD